MPLTSTCHAMTCSNVPQTSHDNILLTNVATVVLPSALSSLQSMTDHYEEPTAPRNPFKYFRYGQGRPRPDSEYAIDPFRQFFTVYLPAPLVQRSNWVVSRQSLYFLADALHANPRNRAVSSSGSSRQSSVRRNSSPSSHPHGPSGDYESSDEGSPTLGYFEHPTFASPPPPHHGQSLANNSEARSPAARAGRHSRASSVSSTDKLTEGAQFADTRNALLGYTSPRRRYLPRRRQVRTSLKKSESSRRLTVQLRFAFL